MKKGNIAFDIVSNISNIASMNIDNKRINERNSVESAYNRQICSECKTGAQEVRISADRICSHTECVKFDACGNMICAWFR